MELYSGFSGCGWTLEVSDYWCGIDVFGLVVEDVGGAVLVVLLVAVLDLTVMCTTCCMCRLKLTGKF